MPFDFSVLDVRDVFEFQRITCFVFFLKETHDQLPKEENFDQHINLKQITHLKEIEQLLNDY